MNKCIRESQWDSLEQRTVQRVQVGNKKEQIQKKKETHSKRTKGYNKVRRMLGKKRNWEVALYNAIKDAGDKRDEICTFSTRQR